jgi:hypothetical protein
MSNFGHFEGEVITKWLKDDDGKDRTMELMEDFSYIDPSGKQWLAAQGRTVDGASIPAAFWSGTLGSPFVGDYRRATVLHDIACQDQTEPHREVHRMFYDAMRCDGVALLKAMTMFKAVDTFGPKWGPAVAFAATPQMSTDDVVTLEAATNTAIAELGEDADLETLNQRIDEILRQAD